MSYFSEKQEKIFFAFILEKIKISQKWAVFTAAIFLVTVPVFFQAPMVRQLPWLILAMT